MRSSTRCKGQRGQAAVEFAIALPLVAMLVVGVLYVAVVVRDQLAVEVAARDGARAAAVSAAPAAAAATAANSASSLEPLDVTTSTTATRVNVTVRYRSDRRLPLLGWAFGSREVTATVVMAREPP